MAYREFRVVDIRAILGWWFRGLGLRAIARRSGFDRRTVRRYVEAAEAEGLTQEAGLSALTETRLAAIRRRVRPGRAGDFGDAWRTCERHSEQIRQWLDEDLTVVKVRELLRRRGVALPYRTLHRFAATRLGFKTNRTTTVRIAEREPGDELQIDFGSFGLLYDPQTQRRRRLKALILTAVYSRHSFVWPLWSESFEDVIEGLEAAWDFFGGVFPVVIPDNFKAVVTTADPLEPLLSEQFADYAEARGFAVDTARIRRPKDKPHVERMVQYVRDNFFAGETFVDIADVRRRAEHWSRVTAGERIHGTTCRQPAIVFEVEELPLLLAAPTTPYDPPIFTSAKVGRDQHFSFKKALYSMPKHLVGRRVKLRADSRLVKVWVDGEFIRAHPRQPPGGCSTLSEDIDKAMRPLVQRDSASLQVMADAAGPAVSTYTRRLLEGPHPWRRMRHVYRLLHLVRRYGAEPVERACSLALELDVVDVTRVSRIVESGGDEPPPKPPAQPAQTAILRFARPKDHFALRRDDPPEFAP